jgi:ubiquinone/menaquinone biosynthesis C-methylase UbiE
MAWLRKSETLEPLAVAMPGVKLGNRLLVVGCGDPELIAALAAKAGLTGRACAVDADEARVAKAARDVERAGSLIETAVAHLPLLPYEDRAFDIVVVRDVLPGLNDRDSLLHEVQRVLRPGGRCIAIDTTGAGGLAGLFGSRTANPDYVAAGGAAAALTAAGFFAVRTLAERDRLAFAEGVKRNE